MSESLFDTVVAMELSSLSVSYISVVVLISILNEEFIDGIDMEMECWSNDISDGEDSSEESKYEPAKLNTASGVSMDESEESSDILFSSIDEASPSEFSSSFAKLMSLPLITFSRHVGHVLFFDNQV